MPGYALHRVLPQCMGNKYLAMIVPAQQDLRLRFPGKSIMKYFLPDGRGGKPAHFPGENIRQQPQFALTNGFRIEGLINKGVNVSSWVIVPSKSKKAMFFFILVTLYRHTGAAKVRLIYFFPAWRQDPA